MRRRNALRVRLGAPESLIPIHSSTGAWIGGRGGPYFRRTTLTRLIYPRARDALQGPQPARATTVGGFIVSTVRQSNVRLAPRGTEMDSPIGPTALQRCWPTERDSGFGTDGCTARTDQPSSTRMGRANGFWVVAFTGLMVVPFTSRHHPHGLCGASMGRSRSTRSCAQCSAVGSPCAP